MSLSSPSPDRFLIEFTGNAEAWLDTARYPGRTDERYVIDRTADSSRYLIFCYLVSDNPQILHQALLLMADMAKLTPDAVLHNVMPVFTFMGSHVFHRDDPYSFTVVQRVGGAHVATSYTTNQSALDN